MVRCVAVDPSGHWIATVSADETLRIWEARHLLPMLAHHQMNVGGAQTHRTVLVEQAETERKSTLLGGGNWETRALLQVQVRGYGCGCSTQ